MRKTPFVNILIVTLLAAMTAFISACTPAKSTPQNTTIKPVKLYQVPGISAAGYDAFLAEVDAGERSQLSFQVPGVINKLQVRDGQRVKKDQLLAILDPSDYQLAVDARQAQYDLAKTRYLRNQQLHSKKLISTDTLDQSETAFKAADANLKEAKTELSYTRLKAPFDGVVSITFVKAHQFVAAKTPILNIINNDQLDITFSIPVPYVETMGVNTLQKKKFAVVFDLYNAMMVPAQFKEISTQADPETNSYTTTVTILRPNGINILTGMTGQVLTANTLKGNPLQLPDESWIDKQADKGKVWRYNQQSNTVKAVEVQLNESGAIISGLVEGDLIVTAGAKDLTEGQTVRAWKREGGI
ncbi:MAG: efflux RND transporter periplasmic adaptor subunit [Psychromonas sp.]